MDIHHKNINQYAQFVKSWQLKNLAQLDIIDICYMHIDTHHQFLHMLSSNLDWYDLFWQNQLDLSLSLRIQQECTYWFDLDAAHQNTLAQFAPDTERADLCLHHQGVFDLLSVHSPQILGLQDYSLCFRALPTLSYHAHKFRKKDQCVFPIRDQAVFDVEFAEVNLEKCNAVEQETRYRFNGINLTALEIKYLSCLSSLMSQKEIAYHFKVSETAVRKVIGNVKRKFGHDAMPNSKLFRLLKQYGVTLTYFNHLI